MPDPITTAFGLKLALLATGIKISVIKVGILTANHPWILTKAPTFLKLCKALKNGDTDRAAEELGNFGKGALGGEFFGMLFDVIGGEEMQNTLEEAEEKHRKLTEGRVSHLE